MAEGDYDYRYVNHLEQNAEPIGDYPDDVGDEVEGDGMEEENEDDDDEGEYEEEDDDESEEDDDESEEYEDGEESENESEYGTEEELEESEWNRSEVEGLFCPICFEPWTSQGDHHISCLPCGHIFGLSCITKWIERKGSSAKCPQCTRKFRLKHIRRLFAPKIAAVDEASQKRIQYLESKCASLERQRSNLRKKEHKLKREVDKLAFELNCVIDEFVVDIKKTAEEHHDQAHSEHFTTPESQPTQEDKRVACLKGAGDVRPNGCVYGNGSHSRIIYADFIRSLRASRSAEISELRQEQHSLLHRVDQLEASVSSQKEHMKTFSVQMENMKTSIAQMELHMKTLIAQMGHMPSSASTSQP